MEENIVRLEAVMEQYVKFVEHVSLKEENRLKHKRHRIIKIDYFMFKKVLI